MKTVKVFVVTLTHVEIVPDEMEEINTGPGRMSNSRCFGHLQQDGQVGELGERNPKITILSGGNRYLLCNSCARSQNLI